MYTYILKHFQFNHMREDLSEVVEPYQTLAKYMEEILADSPDKTVALRKLLESCDSAIRARCLDKEENTDREVHQPKHLIPTQRTGGRDGNTN